MSPIIILTLFGGAVAIAAMGGKKTVQAETVPSVTPNPSSSVTTNEALSAAGWVYKDTQMVGEQEFTVWEMTGKVTPTRLVTATNPDSTETWMLLYTIVNGVKQVAAQNPEADLSRVSQANNLPAIV